MNNSPKFESTWSDILLRHQLILFLFFKNHFWYISNFNCVISTNYRNILNKLLKVIDDDHPIPSNVRYTSLIRILFVHLKKFAFICNNVNVLTQILNYSWHRLGDITANMVLIHKSNVYFSYINLILKKKMIYKL